MSIVLHLHSVVRFPQFYQIPRCSSVCTISFFKVARSACSKPCIKFDVIAESGELCEFEYLCNTKTGTRALLEVAIVDYVTLLIV